MNEASGLLRVLGDAVRLRLLRILSREALNVSELTAVLSLAQSGVSRHLGLLRKAGLVVEERRGAFTWYRLAPHSDLPDDARAPLWAWLRCEFVRATEETRAAFGAAFTVWVDRIAAGRFDDTNRLFTPPAAFDVKVEAPGAASYWAERIARLLDTARYAEGLDASPVARRAFSMARTSQIETS